jgi:hypothetical protein
MMIEGIRVGLKEELLVGPGKLGTPAIAQSIRLSRFYLFCVTGLVLIGLAFSSAFGGAAADRLRAAAAVQSATQSVDRCRPTGSRALAWPSSPSIPWRAIALHSRNRFIQHVPMVDAHDAVRTAPS